MFNRESLRLCWKLMALVILFGSLQLIDARTASGQTASCEAQLGTCVYVCSTVQGGNYAACVASCSPAYEQCRFGGGGVSIIQHAPLEGTGAEGTPVDIATRIYLNCVNKHIVPEDFQVLYSACRAAGNSRQFCCADIANYYD